MATGDLKVLMADPTTGALRLGVCRPPEFVSGIDKLVQIVALALLNMGGRSIFGTSPTGGLRALMGANVDYDDPSELFGDVRITVSSIEQSIKRAQVTTTRPPAERLARLQLVDIVADEADLGVRVLLGVVNEEESQGQALVALT